MKKLFSIMLAVVMLAQCLTACGDSSSTANSEKTESSSSAETTTTTAESKTEATTTTKEETKSTADPNGYAQKLVGVWKYEKVIRDSFLDKDAKHQGNIILTDNGKWIDWGNYVYADSQTIHHYGPNVYDYKIENNMLDNRYIVEMTDKKFALNDTDSHINAQEYIKSDLGKTTIDEAMKITDAYQCAYAIKSAIIKTENVKIILIPREQFLFRHWKTQMILLRKTYIGALRNMQKITEKMKAILDMCTITPVGLKQ